MACSWTGRSVPTVNALAVEAHDKARRPRADGLVWWLMRRTNVQLFQNGDDYRNGGADE
jgi:hypothetical protein